MSDDHLTVVYRWEVRDPKRRSGWRRLGWAMSEETAAEHARVNGEELRRVEGSREERRDLQGFSTIKAGVELHHYPKPKPDNG